MYRGGCHLLDFDSNVITPGTPFMDRLSTALRYYIHDRMQNDVNWHNLTVIFSDAQVPGEGEHKILEFIRLQRAQHGYAPNLVHCLYGADADLIMLGLSTHEVNFFVLREAIIQSFEKKCFRCNRPGHLAIDCKGEADPETETEKPSAKVQFQLISIWRVRECLECEFANISLPFEKDFERIIDDFVFLCFFVGNDFLPHLPSLYIRRGAIDAIMLVYKTLLPSFGDYLTHHGKINRGVLDVLFERMSVVEDEILKNDQAFQEQQRARNDHQQVEAKQQQEQKEFLAHREEELHTRLRNLSQQLQGAIARSSSADEQAEHERQFGLQSVDLQQQLRRVQEQRQRQNGNRQDARPREPRREAGDTATIPNAGAKPTPAEFAKQVKEMLKQEEEQQVKNYEDTIQLGKAGYKTRYYIEKFNVDEADRVEFLGKIKHSYMEGLSWVLDYYYNGCMSWGWYYPYHYAPFVSDLLGSQALSPPKYNAS
jgi:5'-3' exoribonuclease 2